MKQLLREKIIALIHSGDLRRYFRERQNDIPDIMYFQTIGVAPVSLKLKKRLMTQCANDAETDDETREFAEATVKEVAGAFSRLYHPIEGNIFVAEQYAMHEIGGHNMDIRTKHTDVELMKNFEAVKAHMDQRKYWDWADRAGETFFGFDNRQIERKLAMQISIYAKMDMERLIRRGFPQNTAVICFYDSCENPPDYSSVTENVIRVPLDDFQTDLPQAKEIADFIHRTHEEGKNIMCQCEKGRNRSAGCAAAILEYYCHDGQIIFNENKYAPDEMVYYAVLNALEE